MSKQVRSLYVIMVELICCLENSVKLKYILKWYYSMLFAALFTAVSCGASFVKNRLTVYVLRIIMLFVCCWMFLLGAVLVICLLNMMLLLFTRWFVYNSILFCVYWLKVKMLLLKVLLNRTDFFSPRLCRSGELTYIYNFIA